MTLVRDPIYQQLNQSLRGLMRGDAATNGNEGRREGERFAPGDRFLTERQICERFGVSRATANKALANLVAEGLLEFRKGVGTFVRGGILDYDLRSLVSFTDKARAAGRKPTTRVLDFRTVAASEAEADITGDIAALKLRPDDAVHVLARLRLADGVPVILERRVIAAAPCPKLRKSDLSGSLYAVWTERYGLEIAGADQVIRAVAVGAADAELLAVKRGSPGLLVTSLGVLANGRPLWAERTLYRADAYEFHNRLGGLRTARPAVGRLLDAAK